VTKRVLGRATWDLDVVKMIGDLLAGLLLGGQPFLGPRISRILPVGEIPQDR
jgi:hypothetical protein